MVSIKGNHVVFCCSLIVDVVFVCNLKLLCWQLLAVGVRKPCWRVSLRSLDWYTYSDFDWLHNRFLYVPHIGPRFAGLERSQSTVGPGQRKSTLCLRDVGIRTRLRSCVNATGPLSIICFQELLQRMVFPFQCFESSGEVTFFPGPTRHSCVWAVLGCAGQYAPKEQGIRGWLHHTHRHSRLLHLSAMPPGQASLWAWGLGFIINWLVGSKFTIFQSWYLSSSTNYFYVFVSDRGRTVCFLW